MGITDSYCTERAVRRVDNSDEKARGARRAQCLCSAFQGPRTVCYCVEPPRGGRKALLREGVLRRMMMIAGGGFGTSGWFRIDCRTCTLGMLSRDWQSSKTALEHTDTSFAVRGQNKT